MLDYDLKILGFTDKEEAVYLEVLKRGKTSPGIVARTTGINRATVYSVAKTLIEKGVIAGDLGGRSMYLTALPPTQLHAMVEREQRILLEKQEAAERAAEVLRPLLKETQYSIPKIRFIDESQMEEYLYDNIDKWNSSALEFDGIHWGFQDHSYAMHFHEWIDEFWRRSPSGIKVRLLSNRSEIEQRISKRGYRERGIAFWKQEFDFTATIWAVGHYIVLIYTQERPFYLIDIFNPVFAENMRSLFRSLWEEVIGAIDLPEKA